MEAQIVLFVVTSLLLIAKFCWMLKFVLLGTKK